MPHTAATYNPCNTSTHQLVRAANAQTYALSVSYGDWGKIQEYGLQQTDLGSNTTTSQTRTYNYGSLNEGQTTFAPNSINYADGTNVNEQYGINGSLLRRETTIPNAQPNEELYRFGADGNLRMYSYDRLFFALYGYDGGTTRTYKYSFDLKPQWVNGRLEAVNFNPHTAMFYPNSYLNFNSNGYYTKHYYNGMERIASRLGDQNLPISTHDPELQDRKDWQDSLIRKNVTEITGYEFLPVGEEQTIDDPKPIFELPVIGISNLLPSADGIYYYHSNHLGSTCYVTDENATVQQGFLYAPFGEITNEYNNSFGNNVLPKYSFNAKELDEETGMYYYEARYYAPPVFISRDPLFEKYPTFSPYAYCVNNPIKCIDPTGDSIVICYYETVFASLFGKAKYLIYTQGMTYDGDNEFVRNVVSSLNYIYDNGADVNDIISQSSSLETPAVTITQRYQNAFFPATKTITWNMKASYVVDNSTWKICGRQSAALALFHELGHFFHYFTDPNEYDDYRSTKDIQYDDMEERRTIEQIESPAAKILGECTRNYHSDKYGRNLHFVAVSPVSTKTKRELK